MKKIVSLLLVAVVLLSFAACNGNKNGIDNADFAVSEYGENGGITIDGYIGQAADLIIPEKIDGKMVEAISDSAFIEDNVLTSIIIPDTVKEIGDKAFYYCINMTKVVVGSGVETIGNNAFWGCYAVTDFQIKGNALKTISDYAFSHLDGVESIKFPESVESVGVGAFEESNALVLEVKDGSYMHTYASENGIAYIVY